MATYTGHETKMLLNMNKPVYKKTNLTNKLGYTVLGVFGMVIVVALVLAFHSMKSIGNPS